MFGFFGRGRRGRQGPPMEFQKPRADLAGDTSAIQPLAGWADVPGMSLSLTSSGGTIHLHLTAVLGVAIGGQMRVLIDGTPYSDVAIIGPLDLPVLGGSGAISPSLWKDIPAGIYTIRLQVKAVGILSSVTPRAGTNMFIVEHPS